jgi:hypothetical protein
MGNLAELNFDANKVEPNAGFDPIPAGTYEVVIIGSKVKPTKSGTGKFIELAMQVLNGPYQNRQLWDRLNLWNDNDKAVQIARGTMSAICRAVGVLTPGDTSELHNRPLCCTVKVKPDQNGNPRNEVSGYKPRVQQRAPSAAPAQAAQQTPAVQNTAAATTGASDEQAPWNR